MQKMGVAEGPVCTNQSSVYAEDGRGKESCMHQSEFTLCRNRVWPRFQFQGAPFPVRVQKDKVSNLFCELES